MVYVVSEWVSATSLVDLLAEGPLPAAEAHAMALDVAGALAGAHEQGLSHLCLQPEHVLRTPHGQVKVAGLQVDAAARGLEATGPDDAAHRDTAGRSVGALRRPHRPLARRRRHPAGPGTARRRARCSAPARSGPASPTTSTTPSAGRWACPAVTTRGAPLRTPAALRDALSAAHVTSRVPVVPPVPPAPRGAAPFETPQAPPYDDRGTARAATRRGHARLGRRGAGAGRRARPLRRAARCSPVSGATATSRRKARATGRPGRSTRRGSPASRSSTRPPSTRPPGNGEENSDRAGRAVDGDPSTAWPTKTYNDQFGPTGLKFGVGLLLDLGKTQDVARVAITVEGGATDLELRVAEDAGDSLEDYELVDEAADVDGRTVLRPADPVTARYVLVWLTQLPARDGKYRGEVAEVTVSG